MNRIQESIFVLNMKFERQFANESLCQFLLQVAQDMYMEQDVDYIMNQPIFKEYRFDQNYSIESPSLSLIQIVQQWNSESHINLYQISISQDDQSTLHEDYLVNIKVEHSDYANQPSYFIYLQDMTVLMECQKAQMENKYSQLTTQTLSHELMTPLNSITNLSQLSIELMDELLLPTLETSPEPSRKTLMEVREMIKVTNDSSQQMFFLIKSQIDLQHIKTQTLRTSYEVVVLRDEVLRMFELVKSQAKSNEVTLSVQVEDGLEGKLTIEALRYRTILYILLQNAIKFTFKGNVKVEVYHNQFWNSYIMTKVSDNGIGIAKDKLKNIFRMYSQVKSGQCSLSSNGVGLGLSTCKKILEYLGGDIEVISEAHKGTDVIFSMEMIPNDTSIIDQMGPIPPKSNPKMNRTQKPSSFSQQMCSRPTLATTRRNSSETNLFHKLNYLRTKQQTILDSSSSEQSLDSSIVNRKLHLSQCSQLNSRYQLNTSYKSENEILNQMSIDQPYNENQNNLLPSLSLDNVIASTGIIQMTAEPLVNHHQNDQESCYHSQQSKSLRQVHPVKEQNNNKVSCECRNNILVVDDQEFNLIPLEIYFMRQHSLSVTKAKDGLYAVEKYKQLAETPCCQDSFGLIIMDINMPLMDGITASRHILHYTLQHAITPPLICALTAYENESNRLNCLQAGIQKILYKPVKFDLLDEVFHQSKQVGEKQQTQEKFRCNTHK